MDDDDHRIAATRAAMRKRVRGLWVRFGVGQFLILFASFPRESYPPVPPTVADLSPLVLGAALSLASAGFAGVLTFRHWAALTGGAIAAGLLPWAIVLGETTLILLAAA